MKNLDKMNSVRNSGAKILAFLSIFVLVLANASCPNNCNGQGECDKYSRCHCAEGNQGADCSEMICPFGLAWADQATETDVAHNMAECSNRGLCDRSSGLLGVVFWTFNKNLMSYFLLLHQT